MFQRSRIRNLAITLLALVLFGLQLPISQAAESRLQVRTKDTVDLKRSDPMVQRFRLPGQPGAPVSVRADHDGENCFGGGSSQVQFGTGQEQECQTETRNGTTGTMCCPVVCSYQCQNIREGKGTFKGTCRSDQAANCTWTPNTPGGGGNGILQDQGLN